MRMAPEIRSMEKELPRIFRARPGSPAPLAIEKSGAPPIPNRLAKAVMIVMTGRVRPIPVSVWVDMSGR